MSGSISKKATTATKWSLVTQVVSKLISPITTLILAHLLAPEVFGIVALVTMVTSFAEMISDAGFQKYLIQHEYESKEHFYLSANVAFWTNLLISLFLWLAIFIFRDDLARILGDSSIGLAIVIASLALPLMALVSVQTAIYQRTFDFKTLFYCRVGSSLLILVVSVPLAYFGWGYWSMIFGSVSSSLFLAVSLTFKSFWKPSFKYSLKELKAMLSFSIWTLVEAFSIWLTNWIGAFILGTLMSAYYLGLYNTSISLVNAVIAIVTGAINPIIFSSLSRFQTDRKKFDSSFYQVQKYLGFAVVPMAAALFVFSEAVVGLYLGSAWLEATLFFAFYSLTSAFVVVFGHVSSEAYRAIGKPRYSFLAQLGFLAFLIPGLLIGAMFGFKVLSIIVPMFRLMGCLLTHSLICKFLMGLSPLKMFYNLRWVYFVTLLISVVSSGLIFTFDFGYLEQCLLLLFATLLYFALCVLFNDTRQILFSIARRFGFYNALVRIIPKRFVC